MLSIILLQGGSVQKSSLLMRIVWAAAEPLRHVLCSQSACAGCQLLCRHLPVQEDQVSAGQLCGAAAAQEGLKTSAHS